MPEEPPGANGPEETSAGEPTGVLSDFEQPSPAGFVHRVRNRIHRRVLALEVVDLTWRGPALVFFQWLLFVIDFVRGAPPTEGARHDE